LRDTAAPGYTAFGDDEWYYGLGNGGDFGYTPANRLAFLRAEGYDPVDLSFSGSRQIRPEVALPFFPDNGAPVGVASPLPPGTPPPPRPEMGPAERWRRFRNAANVRFLADLHQRLRAARPVLPLFVAERSSHALSDIAYWGSWDKADALPRAQQITDPNGSTRERSPRALSRRVLFNARVYPSADRSVLVGQFADFAFKMSGRAGDDAGAWDGGVLDLSALEPAKAAELLQTPTP
jgi:hypothetical protein